MDSIVHCKGHSAGKKVHCLNLEDVEYRCSVQSGTITLRIFAHRKNFLPTLTPSRGLKNYFFLMKFFSQDPLYASNICTKFQVQMIYTKKDI